MSRGVTFTMNFELSAADAQMEAFVRKWQPVLQNMMPGSTVTATTFGGGPASGGNAGANPSVWRATDPIQQNAVTRLHEPKMYGTPVSRLPTSIQQALAAADPVVAEFLSQPNPQDIIDRNKRIAAAERRYRAGVRYETRDYTANRREEDSYLTGVSRSAIDDERAAASRRRAAESLYRSGVSQETRSYRSDLREEDRHLRASSKEAIEAERDRDRGWADERRLQARYRTEAERANRADDQLDRSSFRADIAGRNSSQKVAAIRERMQGLDPQSLEYQQLRAQANNMAPNTGMNQSIMPGHMYMQLMFGLYDLAKANRAITEGRTNAMLAPSGPQAALAQAQAVTQAGSGTISSIVTEVWNTAGQIFGFRTPAKALATSRTEAERYKVVQSSIVQEDANTSSFARLGTFGGSSEREIADSRAKTSADIIGINQQMEDIETLFGSGAVDDEGYAQALRRKHRALRKAKDVRIGTGFDEVVDIEHRRDMKTADIYSEARAADILANGGSSRDAEAEQLERHLSKSIDDANREQDPTRISATRDYVEATRRRFNRDWAVKSKVRQIGRDADVEVSRYGAAGESYEAERAGIVASSFQKIVSADGPSERHDIMLASAIQLSSLQRRFDRDRDIGIASNTSSTLVAQRLIVGDTVGAIKAGLRGQMENELNTMPQGMYRAALEPSVRARYGALESLQVKQENDRLLLQSAALTYQKIDTGQVASGNEKTGAAGAIESRALLEGEAFKRQGQVGNAVDAYKIGVNELKAFQRQLKIAQFTEGSGEEIASGSIGGGGTSTLPGEFEREDTQKALDSIDVKMDQLIDAIRALGGTP